MIYSPSSSSGWGTVQVRGGEGGVTRDARLQRRHPVKEKESSFAPFFEPQRFGAFFATVASPSSGTALPCLNGSLFLGCLSLI